jgi:hypothetical protein
MIHPHNHPLESIQSRKSFASRNNENATEIKTVAIVRKIPVIHDTLKQNDMNLQLNRWTTNINHTGEVTVEIMKNIPTAACL